MRVAEVGIDTGLIECVGCMPICRDYEFELDAHARVREDRVGVAVKVGPGDLGTLPDRDEERLEAVGGGHYDLCLPGGEW